MQSDLKPIAIAIVAALTVACSGTPRTAGPAAGTAAQPNAAPQTLAAANSAAAPATVAAATPVGDVDPRLVKAGYTVMRRHDQVYYCRNEIITGNRIATRVCLTAAQIQDEKQDVTKAKDIMNQPTYQCLGGGCKDPAH